jgi:magnesium-transporting ATPase (P-type)
MQLNKKISASTIEMDIDQATLNGLNVEQARTENRARLDAIGGVEALANKIGVNLELGLTNAQVEELRSKFGQNEFPEAPMQGFISLFIGAFNDSTLLVLLFAAFVSIGIEAWQEPETGWIEGVAIIAAVLFVTTVTATNDYTKELQFRDLEKSSQVDERISVVRNGMVERINPKFLVVGDIIKLQVFLNNK